jgi:hypothetical protein
MKNYCLRLAVLSALTVGLVGCEFNPLPQTQATPKKQIPLSLIPLSKGNSSLLDAWARPASSPQHRQLKTVRILYRAPGSHQLPLSKRPF